MKAYFGPGGNSDAFKAAGNKSTLDAPRWLRSIGLDAYEYEAGNGIAATPAMLSAIGKQAKEHNIKMLQDGNGSYEDQPWNATVLANANKILFHSFEN